MAQAGDDLLPDLLQAVLPVRRLQTVSAKERADAWGEKLVKVVPGLGERGGGGDPPAAALQVSPELVEDLAVRILGAWAGRPRASSAGERAILRPWGALH